MNKVLTISTIEKVAKVLEEKTLKLIDDDEVQSLKGIYKYILTSEEKHLSLRQFDDKTKRKVFEKQKGKCVWCKKTFEFAGMEADHITPWHEGGKTTAMNCQMLCKDDNQKNLENKTLKSFLDLN